MVACTGTPQSGLVLAVEADRQPDPKKDNLPTALHQPTQDRQHQPSLAPMPRHQLWGLCPTVLSGSRGLALWWLVQGPHNQDWCLPSRQTVNHTPRRTTSPPPYTNPSTQDRQLNHRSRRCPGTSCGVSALLSRVAVGVLPYGGLYSDPTIRTGERERERATQGGS